MQMTQTPGNVQTQSACRKEYECDQADHWAEEFFRTDSTWMLKHADDDESREQPQNNAQDPSNCEYDFSDHESPPEVRGGSSRVSTSAFIRGSIEAAEPNVTCSL